MNDLEKTQLRRRLILVAEVALVLAILGLLIATWLPVWVGAHPGIQWR